MLFYIRKHAFRTIARACDFLQRVPQHIATPLLLYGSVHSTRRKLYLRGIVEGMRARFHVLTPLTRPPASVYVYLGIRRMDASPGRSIREFQTVRSTGRDVSPRESFRYSNYSLDDIWRAPRHDAVPPWNCVVVISICRRRIFRAQRECRRGMSNNFLQINVRYNQKWRSTREIIKREEGLLHIKKKKRYKLKDLKEMV